MDQSLALRLNSRSQFYDAELYRKLAKIAADYALNGLQAASYYYPDFDSAYDLANALAGLPVGTNAQQFDRLFDRCTAKNFSHPAGATQIEVLATSISQILFGGETNRKVDARKDDDTTKAEAMNQLLAWNDQMNASYVDGYLWVWDSLIANRGIQYDFWETIYDIEKEPVEYEIPSDKKPRKGQEQKTEKFTRYRTVRKKVGGFCKIVNISPYDFVCDPSLPLSRMNEMRFAGHRVVLTWQELKRRSELPVSDYHYVLPEVVKKLKNQKARKGITAITPGSTMVGTSRSYFERMRRGNPTPEIGLTDKVNKDDGGTVECWCMTVRLRPKNFDIYEDDEDELMEFLIAGETDLLSANVMDNRHGEYPYAVGEARPNAHQQFSPATALIMKPTQDVMDDLKWRHQEQVARSGQLLLVRGTKCNLEEMLADTSRIRQAVTTTEDAEGTPLEEIVRQIPITDTTAKFPEEMSYWKDIMEEASGALPNTQGQTEDPSQTLGQYQDVAQMAMGRLSTKARNLSNRALEPQTRRIAMNMQQWMSDSQTIRIQGGQSDEYDPDEPQAKYLTVRREPLDPEARAAMEAAYQQACQEAISSGQVPPEPPPELTQPDIQFAYDIIPHDGAMPGTDSRAVAAAARLIEASANPAFQQCFNPTVPGNIDPKALLVFTARKAGLPVKNFLISRKTAQENLQKQQAAQGLTPPPDDGTPPAALAPVGPPPPQTPVGASAAILPATPSAEPPQAQGVTLSTQ